MSISKVIVFDLSNSDIKGSFGWRGEKVRGEKMVGGWKSGKIKNILISFIFVWLGVEK